MLNLKPTFSLAPMNDVTDTVFRQVVATCCAPDLFFTEFVNVDGLSTKKGKQAIEDKLTFSEVDSNLVVQVWGLKPENYEAQAKTLAKRGYVGIDINMGCPVDKVVKRGACSALINNRQLAKEIIEATKNGSASIPISVKTRIGFDEIDLTWIEFLLEQNLDALTVHGRTVKELSNVENHWEVFEKIVELKNNISPNTKLIANGDVKSKQHGEEVCRKYSLDGVMIGRAIFNDPYLFNEEDIWSKATTQEKLNLYLSHINLFDKTWGTTKNPNILKKFCKVYLGGFEGAHVLRESVMNERSVDGVRNVISDALKTTYLV